jgi:hypothetical protein
VMLAAHRGLPPRPFARPSGIVELTVCAEGGMLPSPNCPATRRERFIAGSEPHQPDTTHVAVGVDTALGCRAPAGYPAERVTTRVFRVLPPEAEAWSVAAGLPRMPRQTCPTIATTDQGRTTKDERPGVNAASDPSSFVFGPSSAHVAAPALLAPAPGAVFAISPGVPRARQRIELQARAGMDAAKLTIYIDGQALAVLGGPPYRAFWPLAPGAHRATVEATDAQGEVWKGAVVEFVVEGK